MNTKGNGWNPCAWTEARHEGLGPVTDSREGAARRGPPASPASPRLFLVSVSLPRVPSLLLAGFSPSARNKSPGRSGLAFQVLPLRRTSHLPTVSREAPGAWWGDSATDNPPRTRTLKRSAAFPRPQGALLSAESTGARDRGARIPRHPRASPGLGGL